MECFGLESYAHVFWFKMVMIFKFKNYWEQGLLNSKIYLDYSLYNSFIVYTKFFILPNLEPFTQNSTSEQLISTSEKLISTSEPQINTLEKLISTSEPQTIVLQRN